MFSSENLDQWFSIHSLVSGPTHIYCGWLEPEMGTSVISCHHNVPWMPWYYQYCHITSPGCSCSEYPPSWLWLNDLLEQKFLYTAFDIQCSGDHRMMLDILPRNLYATLIFSDYNLFLQDFCFRSCITLIKISGCRHGNSLVHRLYTMGGFLFSIILSIIWLINSQFKGLTSLTLTTKYFFSWGEYSLQYSQLFEVYRYFLCENFGWTWLFIQNMSGHTMHVVHPMVDLQYQYQQPTHILLFFLGLSSSTVKIPLEIFLFLK